MSSITPETIRGTTIPSARWITMATGSVQSSIGNTRSGASCSSVSTLSVRKRISTTTTTSGLRGRSTARCRCRSITRRTSTVFISSIRSSTESGNSTRASARNLPAGGSRRPARRQAKTAPIRPAAGTPRLSFQAPITTATRAGSTDGMNAATRRRMELRSLTRSVRRMARVSLKSRA